jgi:chromosome segregation ATPase
MFTNKQEVVGNEIEYNEDLQKIKLEKEVLSLTNRKNDLEQEVNILVKQQNTLEDVSIKIQEVTKELEILSQEKSKLDSVAHSLQLNSDSLETIKNEIVNKKQELNILKGQLDNGNVELVSLVKDYEVKKEQYTADLSAIQLEVEKNTEENKVLLNNISINVDKVSKLNIQLSTIQSTVDEQQPILDKIILNIELSKKDSVALDAAIQSKKTELQKLISDTEVKAQTIINSAMTQASTIISGATESLTKTKKELDDRDQDLLWREGVLEKKKETLKLIKSELEELHGKKINSIIL